MALDPEEVPWVYMYVREGTWTGPPHLADGTEIPVIELAVAYNSLRRELFGDRGSA